MKLISRVAGLGICLLLSCQSQNRTDVVILKVVHDTITYSDTVPTTYDWARDNFIIPDEYRIEPDPADNGWRIKWVYNNSTWEWVYLRLSSYVKGMYCFADGKEDAALFKTSGEVVDAIKQHWSQVCEDRSKHK